MPLIQAGLDDGQFEGILMTDFTEARARTAEPRARSPGGGSPESPRIPTTAPQPAREKATGVGWRRAEPPLFPVKRAVYSSLVKSGVVVEPPLRSYLAESYLADNDMGSVGGALGAGK